jgi:hypothetical protein
MKVFGENPHRVDRKGQFAAHVAHNVAQRITVIDEKRFAAISQVDRKEKSAARRMVSSVLNHWPILSVVSSPEYASLLPGYAGWPQASPLDGGVRPQPHGPTFISTAMGYNEAAIAPRELGGAGTVERMNVA